MSSRSGRTKRGRTEPIESAAASVASDAATAAETEQGNPSAVTEPQTESKVVTAAKLPRLSHQPATADGMYM